MVATHVSSAPLIVIFGASGNQGGSVIDHLIASTKSYRIRAVTRDPSKPASRALSDKGVEVVAGDLADKGSVERAVANADIVFGVTNYWALMSRKKEVEQGKALVDASKAAGVKLFVWSGLENVAQGSNGKYTGVEHFDGKADITLYASEHVPTLVVQPGCYAQNFLTMMAPKKQEDGTYAIFLPISPQSPFSLVDISRDYGAYVVEGIEDPAFGAGKEVLAASEVISIEEVARQIGLGTGKTVTFVQVPDEALLQAMPGPAGQDVLQMLKWFQDFGYFGPKDIGPSNAHLAQQPHKFIDFVKATDWSKVLA